MNKIYLISNSFNYEINLIFSNNTFEKDGLIYNFSLIQKDTLLIFWNETNKQLFYTDDSYLYYSNIELKSNFKKIFLVHSEWYDQAIIILNKMKLYRIKNNEQSGDIIFNDENLIINWNFWGKEEFIKKDDFTYVQKDYIFLKKNILINEIPIHIFIHICMIDNWKDIFEEQINTIKKSGLYDITEKIHLALLGNISNFLLLKDDIFTDEKYDILYIDSRVTLFEIHTINFIKTFCNSVNNEIYVLYIHTKGVRNVGNREVTRSWRNMMEYFLIENFKECIDYLSIFDTIGNNTINSYCEDNVNINNNHTYHYSGNFWWSKKSYIDKLIYLDLDLTDNSINTRYKAENWILSLYPDAYVGILFQDETNIHPYHRYIFEYYKNMKIFLKKLK